MAVLRVPVEQLSEGELWLNEEAANYVARVHRCAVGDLLELLDPRQARQASAVITALEGRRVCCRVDCVVVAPRCAQYPVTLIQSLGKSDKVDQVVRDATVLGATRIIVLTTERSVVKLARRAAEERLQRWERIAIEAARQSGRGDMPRIEGPLGWKELGPCLANEAGPKLLLDVHAEQPLTLALGTDRRSAVTFLVGPEGGFEPDELVQASQLGFRAVRFGDFVLRTETVAPALLGALLGWRQSAG